MEGLLLALVLLHLSAAADNLYALTATDIVGNKVSLQEYKGKVLCTKLSSYLVTCTGYSGATLGHGGDLTN